MNDIASDPFEVGSWDDRYSGKESVWSGNPNAQLVAEVTHLTPSTALGVGCGEGADVIWLAQHGWRVTGADFSARGLARAAQHAEAVGVADRVAWWQIDAREFEAGGRTYDLVTSHFLHLPDAGTVNATRCLAKTVAPGGRLLLVGHAPSEHFAHIDHDDRRALWNAVDLVRALPEDFEALVVEQRHDAWFITGRRSTPTTPRCSHDAEREPVPV